MLGCFLAVRAGSPSLLIPINLAWKYQAENYRIMDPPEGSPDISETILFSESVLSKGDGAGDELSLASSDKSKPASSPLPSKPLRAAGKSAGRKRAKTKKRTRV